jgi:hypothetical protein
MYWNQVDTTLRYHLRSCSESSVKAWNISVNIARLPCDIEIGNLITKQQCQLSVALVCNVSYWSLATLYVELLTLWCAVQLPCSE